MRNLPLAVGYFNCQRRFAGASGSPDDRRLDRQANLPHSSLPGHGAEVYNMLKFCYGIPCWVSYP
jgi:hypothetical protein